MALTVSADNAITAYLAKTDPDKIHPGFLSYIANLTQVASVAPGIARGIVQELADQRAYIKLIASENYCSLATQAAMGNLLTDKYAEGFPGTRFYEGCDNIDDLEAYACAQACKLFGCDHAYVQPHSGADANMVAFWAILQARITVPKLAELNAKDPSALSHEDWERIRQAMGNQRLLGLNLAAGGHLTHGYRHNVSGKMFEAHSYGVHPETHLLDYDAIEKQAREVKPLILLAGYSAYPRAIDFKRMRAIADAVGAVLMVDMAHFAGLVAGGVFMGDHSPFPHAHIVTSTTHKTLRGPRGGVVLSTKEFAEYVDKGCPMVLGGPLSHIMAAKGVAFTEANTPAFKIYAHKIVENAKTLAESCISEGMKVVSNGTDNHLMLIDVTTYGLTGRQAASALRECGITLNKNTIPFDQNTPLVTSGLRLGTPAVTTLGMGAEEMKEIAATIKFALSNTKPDLVESGANAGKPSKIKHTIDATALETAKSRTKKLLDRYPVYPELDLAFLQEHFA